jgi:signal transduction histidine kinase
MNTEKRRIVGTNTNPKPQAVAGVVAEPRMGKLSDKEFAQAFQLFFQAVSHEMGGNFQILFQFRCWQRDDKSKELVKIVRKTDRLSDLVKRLDRLRNFATRDFPVLDCGGGKFCSLFTEKERERLGAKGPVETWQVDYDEVRRIGLKTIGKMRPLLKELCTSLAEKMPENADRDLKSLANGEIAINYMEKLLRGDLDFGQTSRRKMIKLKVFCGIPSNNHRIITNTKIEAGALQREVEVIPPLLHLITDNIFSNAKRSMVEKGLTEFSMEVGIRTENGMAVCEFKDNGNGMPPEIMEKLNRGEKVTTKPAETPGEHGLGFGYCRELAEKMGGRLYVKESIVGAGTTVVLELRLA